MNINMVTTKEAKEHFKRAQVIPQRNNYPKLTGNAVVPAKTPGVH